MTNQQPERSDALSQATANKSAEASEERSDALSQATAKESAEASKERSDALAQATANKSAEASKERSDTVTPHPGPIAKQPDCELCEAARFTHWYHEDDTCWIADCEACAVPMVVWKPHGINPSSAEVDHMLNALQSAAKDRFGDTEVAIDQDMRTIPEHWHAHARDIDWFRQRSLRPMSRYTSVGGDRVER